jgi:hypothetical protein
LISSAKSASNRPRTLPRGRTFAKPGLKLPAQPRAPLDPNQIAPATRDEILPTALAAVVLAFITLIVCFSHGYTLLYGDAVAHLGIARRILDSRSPGLSQLGGVWLPLPHLLMLPFIQKMEWWQNGLAGAWPSLICYVLGVPGFYRLARRMLVPRWALVATAFYALNPNLLYLATTAMTEPLFLTLLIWIAVFTVECVDALNTGKQHRRASLKLIALGLLIFAAVFTRYDGWVLGAIVWSILAWHLWKARALWQQVAPAFALFTLLTVAGPILWLWYNQHFFHDPLDFLRGPYSAAAIEKKTSPPGARHYRGWHNPTWALLFYTRTAQVDAAVWETGFAILAAALAGLWLAIRRRTQLASLLLWMPLAFYVYSIAYGSVPIFIPQLYPHSYYNARYGMELLPALALFTFLAVAAFETWLTTKQPIAARLLQPILLLFVAVNALTMMYTVPLVLKEAQVNSTTRVAFERAIAEIIDSFPPGLPILMYNSDHVGAIQQAGIPLRQTVNEGDWYTWHPALHDPAGHAAYIIAIAGDPVAQAVAEHPDGLQELTVLCTSGQPCARIYQSTRFTPPQH